MKYKVDFSEIQGINKKIYKAGDIVSDEMFPKGNAKELAEKGYLIPLTKVEVDFVKKAETEDAAKIKAAENAAKAKVANSKPQNSAKK